MPIETKMALDAAKTTGEVLKHLVSLKAKLTAQPEPAAHELAFALAQVQATLDAVTAEIARFLGLGASEQVLQAGVAQLASMEGIALRTRVDGARGHCTAIDNIYVKHLDKWFRGKLSEVEYLHVKADFDLLRDADAGLFERMCSVCNDLSVEATAVYDLVLEKQWAAARDRILTSRPPLRELEKTLGAAMSTLNELKNDLIATSGATRLG